MWASPSKTASMPPSSVAWRPTAPPGRCDSWPGRSTPRVTLGAAALARQHLLAELAQSGALDAQRRLVLSAVPRRIGLICARDGAGTADVHAVLDGSPDAFEVVEWRAAMSGANAPGHLAAAVSRRCRQGVDLILVARGGGPRSDLAAWDSPELAWAIARCPVPVWTALGHATDRTVADEVANAAFPASSAAAAALVARAEAAVREEKTSRLQERQHVELSQARHRARWAVAVAVAVVAVLLLVLLLVSISPRG